jgi:hypothetical protein
MGYLDHLSIEQLERADWSMFTTVEKVMVAGELFHRAPVADPFVRRQWVAQLLGLPLREVNRILWRTAGIRWPTVPPKNPPGGKRRKAAGAHESDPCDEVPGA